MCLYLQHVQTALTGNFDLEMARHEERVEWKSVLTKRGELCVMISGTCQTQW